MPHAPLSNLIQWQITGGGAGGRADAAVRVDQLRRLVPGDFLDAGARAARSCSSTRKAARSGRLWHHCARAERIARLFLPYVALQQLAEEAKRSRICRSTLVEVITAGEQLQVTPQIAALFRRLPRRIAINQYGPARATS